MKFAFDLISDLHIETWPDFDWSSSATSPICVLPGDVAVDHSVLAHTLEHLSQCYQAVFYIDGNEEHKHCWEDLQRNIASIKDIVDHIPGVVYLQDNVAIIQGVAFLAANGWWTWDFDPTIDRSQSQQWFLDRTKSNSFVPGMIESLAESDARYLCSSVSRLQKHNDIKRIVMITHTVPNQSFVDHDIDLAGTYRMNTMGNQHMDLVLSADTEHKISHWVFGHYHGQIDRIHNNIRYVNNCRGRCDTPFCQIVYHPLRIEIDV